MSETRVMAGYSWRGAVDYAADRGWVINRSAQTFRDGDTLIVWIDPDGSGAQAAERLQGLQVKKEGGVIYGPRGIGEITANRLAAIARL